MQNARLYASVSRFPSNPSARGTDEGGEALRRVPAPSMHEELTDQDR